MITLWQAEWCPYSSAVRERLTELGIDFIARQVEPSEEHRTQVDEIPTLELLGVDDAVTRLHDGNRLDCRHHDLR